jgi:hypothetical protein
LPFGGVFAGTSTKAKKPLTTYFTMYPSDLRHIFEEIKRNPLSAIMFLVLLALLGIGIAYSVGYLQEKGRQSAVPEPGVHESTGSDATVSTTPQGPPGFRITYYRLEGSHTLSRLLAGYAFSENDAFDLQPFIWKNSVYSDLQELLRLLPSHASSPFRLLDLLALGPNQVPLYKDTVEDQTYYGRVPPERRQEQDYFESLDSTPVALRPQSWVGSHFLGRLKALVLSDPYWVVDAPDDLLAPTRNPETLLSAVTYFGLPEGRQILEDVTDPITRELATRYPSHRDLAVVYVSFFHGGYYGAIFVRELSLMALDIENTGGSPLAIDSIELAELKARDLFELSKVDELDAILALIESRKAKVPLEALLPGEHLLIPLALELGVSSAPLGTQDSEFIVDEFRFPTNPDWWDNSTASTFPIQMALDWNADDTVATEEVVIPRSRLSEKKDLRNSFTSAYSVGSRISIRSLSQLLQGGGVKDHPVRRFDPTNLIIRGGAQVGSCPILYVHSSRGWSRHGPVLVNAVGRNQEATEYVSLPPDTVGIRLVEEEPERSYISCLKLTVLVNGFERASNTIGPCNGSEKRRLEKGDSLGLSAPDIQVRPEGYRLAITGYYVPVRQGIVAGPSSPPVDDLR